MGVLNQATRQELLDLLARVPGLDSRQGRDALLRDLPADLVQGIERSEATTVDLDHIVYAADNWWPTAGPVADYPLRQLVLTAMDLALGSEVAPVLQAFLERLPPTLDPSARPRCPYPGMVPFAPEDARFFYGREAEIAEMLRRLRVGRYLLVIGPSGSGKSSLVTAGLLPALARQQPGTWHVVTLRPGATPGAALAEAWGGDPAQPAVAVQALLAANAPATRLLVIVDQFEELFTQAERTAQSAFLTALTALRTVPTATLMLLMRADFYPDLMQSVLWPPGEGERLEIAPLHGDALRAAITRPAADLGVEVEPALVERLVADAADEPGSLPLLQEALVLLWERLHGRSLRLADYAALGSADRSGLAVALATRADATYNALMAAQQSIARRILLRLIAFNEGRADTRRQQPLLALQVPNEDPALFATTVRTLTDHRLLTTSGAGQAAGTRRVDIGHDALIRGWPLLQRWIDQRRTAEQTRRRLEEKASEWVRLGRKAGGLLDAAELPEAERWLASTDAAELGTSAALRDLVAASRRALGAARQRLIGALVGTTLLLAIAIAVGFLAWQTSVEAQRQTRSARAQAISAYAVGELNRDPELSLLLAMEAVSTTKQFDEAIVPQAEDALHSALLRSLVRATLHAAAGHVLSAAFSPDGRLVVTANDDGTARLWDVATAHVQGTVRGHTRAVTGAVFSPDGRALLTVSTDGTAKLWDVTTTQLRATLSDLTGIMLSAAFSPKGQLIVTTSTDGTAKLWDVATQQQLATLPGHGGPVVSAAFSPDGQRVVTASDETAKLWDVATHYEQATLRGHAGPVLNAAFSPDGRTVATASLDGTVKIWNVTTGQEQTTLGDLRTSGGPTSAGAGVAFSPDGRMVVTATSEDGTAKIWDAATGQEQATLRGHTGSVLNATFSPDGQLVVTAGLDGTARVWNVATGQEQITLRRHLGPVNVAAFSPDGQIVLTASDSDGTAKLWDAGIGHEQPTLRGHLGWVNSAMFSPNGRTIVTASDDETAQLWDATTGQEKRTLRGHSGGVENAMFSPDGRLVVTASYDGTARLWGVDTGQEQSILHGVETSGRVDSAAFSPDGKMVLTKGQGGEAKLWDVTTAQERTTLGDSVDSAAFSPDGGLIATARNDGPLKLWEVATGHQRTTLHGQINDVHTIAFSPDGLLVVTVSSNTANKLWVLTTGQERATLGSGSASAVFSPDGRMILTANFGGTATLWDAATGQERATLRGHTAQLRSAAFSPDGHTIVTASYDGTAKLWDPTTGQERATLRGHTKAVSSAVFSPDGRIVVTASYDGTARQYLVRIDDLMALAHRRVTRALTPEERATYLGEQLLTPTPLAITPALDVTRTP